MRGRDPKEGCEREGGQRRGDATRYQAKTSSAAASAGLASNDSKFPTAGDCNRLYAEFAAHFYAAHPVKPAHTGMSIACEVRPQGNYAVFSKGQNDLAAAIVGQILHLQRSADHCTFVWLGSSRPQTTGRRF